MWKWILIALAAVALVIGTMEVIRRSSQEESSASGGDQGALVEHLQGEREYSAAEKRAIAEERSGEDDFQRAERITDSREEDLDKAKGKVKVFTEAIKNN